MLERLFALFGVKLETATRKEVTEILLWSHIGLLASEVSAPEIFDD